MKQPSLVHYLKKQEPPKRGMLEFMAQRLEVSVEELLGVTAVPVDPARESAAVYAAPRLNYRQMVLDLLPLLGRAELEAALHRIFDSPTLTAEEKVEFGRLLRDELQRRPKKEKP
jgi:hypothetical protein